MVRLLIVVVFIMITTQVFSQQNDTIIDSRYTWKELKKIFETAYFDVAKNNFSEDQKQFVRRILDSDLVLIEIPYTGFDKRIHSGQIVCNKLVATDLNNIFKELSQLRFPIEQITPVSQYDYTYNKSNDDNYTYCFDYRKETSSNKRSNHSYGFALDINPVQNPYKSAGKTFPSNAREQLSTGRIRYTDPMGQKVIELFKKYGWSWGGDWKSVKDYMHFQKP